MRGWNPRRIRHCFYVALLLLMVSVCGKDKALPAAVVNSARYSTVHSALMDFYSATAGSGTNDPLLNACHDRCSGRFSGWKSKDGWGSNESYCNWARVACASDAVEVEHLYSMPHHFSTLCAYPSLVVALSAAVPVAASHYQPLSFSSSSQFFCHTLSA